MADEKTDPVAQADTVPKMALSATVRVGLIAAASAVAGGLAVAWWHRKTLQRLNNPIAGDQLKNPVNLDGDDSDSVL